MKQLGALVNGKPIETAGTVDVTDPSSGEVFARTADCGPAEIDQAVMAAREAAASWRHVPVAERARVLREKLRPPHSRVPGSFRRPRGVRAASARHAVCLSRCRSR